jgi:cytochrome c oxidase subunit 2
MISNISSSAAAVDKAFLFIAGISAALLAGVTFFMVYFVVKYNRKKNPNPQDIEGNLLLEILWTVIPVIIVLGMFYYGMKGFVFVRAVPEGAMPVKATARMWTWEFEYENGKKSNELKVPVSKPVKLSINSLDVIHSLYIPAFRIKEDAVPGLETYLWFRPDEKGTYDIFCTEYCGAGHSQMLSKVIVMPEEEFAKWYKEEAAAAVVSKEPTGARLIKEKGCALCHSADGSKILGPTFKGIFGRKIIVTTDGKERGIISDEAYIKKSILDPNADVVKGFPPVMPPQKGILTDKEVEEITDHLKTLK